jgi:protein DEK
MASADAAKPASPPAADPAVDDPMDADPAPHAGEEEQATPQKQQPEKKRGGRRKKGEAAEKTPPSSKKSAGPTVERPSRERKTVERYAELAPRATPAKKSPAILQVSLGDSSLSPSPFLARACRARP